MIVLLIFTLLYMNPQDFLSSFPNLFYDVLLLCLICTNKEGHMPFLSVFCTSILFCFAFFFLLYFFYIEKET